MQRLHESVQTTVYLFETSDATKRICPMTFTLVMAGTLDPLIHGFVGLRRQMVHSYTQGGGGGGGGWSGGAMVLGKLPVPGRPTLWIQ